MYVYIIVVDIFMYIPNCILCECIYKYAYIYIYIYLCVCMLFD